MPWRFPLPPPPPPPPLSRRCLPREGDSETMSIAGRSALWCQSLIRGRRARETDKAELGPIHAKRAATHTADGFFLFRRFYSSGLLPRHKDLQLFILLFPFLKAGDAALSRPISRSGFSSSGKTHHLPLSSHFFTSVQRCLEVQRLARRSESRGFETA